MTDESIVGSIILRLISYLLHYISYFFLTFVGVEFFVIILMNIVNTKFGHIFFSVLSYTPTLELWGKSSFSVGVNEVMKFFTFWSFIAMIIHYFVKRFLKIKVHLVYFIIISTLLHVVAIFRTQSDGMFPIISFFYISSLISFSIYLIINKFSNYIYQFQNSIKKHWKFKNRPNKLNMYIQSCMIKLLL